MRASRHPEAAFLAVMTASATHEVRNVLAIIKESAGLVGDMVQLFGRRGTLDQEKVLRAIDRIDTQVKRGADLLTNLNRLSHTLDQDTSQVELGQEVEQSVYLVQRFARRKGQRVVARERSSQLFATLSALHLQMVLFAALECCMEELPEGALLTVGAGEGEGGTGGPQVEFVGSWEGDAPAPGAGDPTSWRSLENEAASLGARAERGGEGFVIRILFPPAVAG
jgi:hypothetical protein